MIAVPRSSRQQAGITLIELLVSIAIMGIISTMVLGVWFGLSDSYVSTSRSTHQIDFARQGMSRMASEIRDAQGVLGGTDAPMPFVRTYSDEIRFYSTYNMTNAATPGTGIGGSAPRLTRFVYRPDVATGIGNIYREFPGPDGFDTGDDVSTVLITNVANAHENKDVFVYYAYNPISGDLYPSSGTETRIAPSDMVSVAINLLIDVNPGKSPNYTDVSTTVNPRNIRQF